MIMRGHAKLAIRGMALYGIIANRAGVTYRSYGEFEDDHKANIKSLEGHICTKSPGI